MSDDDLDEFDDDEDEDEELPVIGPDGSPQTRVLAESRAERKARRFRGKGGSDPGRRGNTKTADLPAARSRNVAEAQGKTTFTDPGGEDWRDQLANKERGKAASTLTSGKMTHNSGSGFGLA
jgi:hypothetical protein